MKRKWKDPRGETLVEVLASILIGAVSAALLFGAVMASVNIDRRAKDADEDFNNNLIAAESQTAEVTVTDNDVTVKNKDNPTIPEKNVTVKFYGGDGAWSFALPPSTPATPP